jgi:5-methylcytosine-specific restriction endonuclease McrA
VEKIRVVASVSWELDVPADGNVAKAAREYLANLLPAGFDVFISKTSIRNRKPHLQRLGEFTLDEVFAKLTTAEDRIEFKIGEASHLVRMNSHRYFVFKQNPSCVSCGLEGKKFLLEQHPNDKSPHFNLYGEEDGRLVLLTKDHIHAKSHGGEDRHSNYQTMCSICNNLKADLHIPLAGILELRKIYNENRSLPRKKLNSMLHEARRRLVVPLPEEKQAEGIRITADLAIVQEESGLVAVSIYDAEGKTVLACLKKGTLVYPTEVRDKKLILPFNATQFEVHQGLTEQVAKTAFSDTEPQFSVV